MSFRTCSYDQDNIQHKGHANLWYGTCAIEQGALSCKRTQMSMLAHWARAVGTIITPQHVTASAASVWPILIVGAIWRSADNQALTDVEKIPQCPSGSLYDFERSQRHDDGTSYDAKILYPRPACSPRTALMCCYSAWSDPGEGSEEQTDRSIWPRFGVCMYVWIKFLCFQVSVITIELTNRVSRVQLAHLPATKPLHYVMRTYPSLNTPHTATTNKATR